MAAPTTAYLNNDNKLVSGANTYDNYIARFLENTTPTSGDNWGDGYFNSTDSDATKKSKICDIFKLDGFWVEPSGTTQGFVGFAEDGSTNDSYHKSTRSSYKRLRKDGVDYIVYNDAGLNVMPTCTLGSLICRWANFTKVNASYRSSYWNATTAYGYSLNGSGVSNYGTLAAKEEKDKEITILDTGVTEGNTFTLTPYITNSEGTKEATQNTYTALEKIWYAGGAGQNTGQGNVWKLPSEDTPLSDTYLYNAVSGQSQSYFRLSEFIHLDDLPEQGQAPLYDCFGYTNEQLHLGTSNTFASGYYYIANSEETGIPVYGNWMGTEGKVFYVDSNGKFLYYIKREIPIPFVDILVGFNSSTSVTINAEMYIMDNGVKTYYNNNLGEPIYMTGSLAWYSDVTTGGFPSGSTGLGSGFDITQPFTLTIPVGNAISNLKLATLTEPSEVTFSFPYLAMDLSSVSPETSSNTYVVRPTATEYPYL
jgi:hypothetical protein